MHLNAGSVLEEYTLPYHILPEHFYDRSIIDNVYEKELYDILENTQEQKGTAFSYTQGEKGINDITHTPESPGF